MSVGEEKAAGFVSVLLQNPPTVAKYSLKLPRILNIFNIRCLLEGGGFRFCVYFICYRFRQ